jgi:hypothetical protein
MRVARIAPACGLVLLVIGVARAAAQPASPCIQPALNEGAPAAAQCTATPTSPTQTPTSTVTQTPTATRTRTKSKTPIPTITFDPPPTDTPPPTLPPITPPTVTMPPTPTMPPTNTAKPSATKSPTKSVSPTNSPTNAPSPSPTRTPPVTQTPGPSKTSTPTATQTSTPTAAPPPPSPTPTFTPRPKPPPDPCVIPKDPPGPGADKRWYAIGFTTTDIQHAWYGASVEWTNQEMWTLPGVNQFVDETLWIGVRNARKCWIETGDAQGTNEKTGKPERVYYWAENDPITGYDEYEVNGVAHPPIGDFQRYTIFHQVGGAYMIIIGGKMVGVSDQPGDTLYAHVGLETTTPMSRIRGPVRFRNFEVHDGWQFVPWPNRRQSTDPPAWWIWNWPTAVNGIPFFFPPFGAPVPFRGGGQ